MVPFVLFERPAQRRCRNEAQGRRHHGDGQEVDTQSGMRGEHSAVFAKRYFFIHLTVSGAYDGRLTLRHPANGANQVIPSEKFDHIAFDFPSDSVVLSKEGNDLLLPLKTEAGLPLLILYDFLQGQHPGLHRGWNVRFRFRVFAALNEPDLMPAAGPAVAASNAEAAASTSTRTLPSWMGSNVLAALISA